MFFLGGEKFYSILEEKDARRKAREKRLFFGGVYFSKQEEGAPVGVGKGEVLRAGIFPLRVGGENTCGMACRQEEGRVG